MNLGEAYGVVERLLAPLSIGAFFDEVLGRRVAKIAGDAAHPRATLLGADPAAALLASHATHAPRITSHAGAGSPRPPAAGAVADEAAFAARIAAFHDAQHTVRVPGIAALWPELARTGRALEAVLHKPVDVVAFWSRAGARAPVHYDEVDIVCVQLVGSKRWFVSNTPSDLPNAWRASAQGDPELGDHATIDLDVGDLLHVPRGTLHTVQSTSDSVHLSIGFVPFTLRDALIALVDHASDHEVALRTAVPGHIALAARQGRFADLPARVEGGVARLVEAARSPAFVADAVQARASRFLADLPRLSPGADPATGSLTADTRVRHAPLAVAHLSGDGERIDVSLPGRHLYVHRGAERAVVFVTETSEFRVRDVPDMASDDVRIALVQRFVAVGFLELVRS